MALPTSTFSTYAAIGNREDLSDVIYNVDPTDTPIITSIEQTDASAVLHEWQTDALAAASATNAVLEGDDATTDDVTPTVRMSNTCQIMDKVARVTGTQQSVNSAGRSDELAYQVVKKTKELRRDMESAFSQNKAEVTGSTTDARVAASIETWMHTNVDGGVNYAAGSSGASTDGNTAPTDGDQRVFTEAQLKAVLKLCWDNGGDPDCIYVGSFNKQKASTFTGNATRQIGANDKKLVAAIDLYSSDFGDIEIMPSRFHRSRSALLLQKDMWAVAYLRRPGMSPLAKTGDSERRQIIVEATIEARNALSSGIVADLTTS